MARPKCCRRVDGEPDCRIFKPAGVPRAVLEEIILSIDEFEAIRLADLEGLYHEQAAARMNVSRPTFGRIIEEARGKVARVLVEGLALRIEGGAIEMAEKRTFECRQCQQKWSVPYGTGRPTACPVCQSNSISRCEEERGVGRSGQGCRRDTSRKPK
jgi:predicted DNA-binding protein (UPF0251 family)